MMLCSWTWLLLLPLASPIILVRHNRRNDDISRARKRGSRALVMKDASMVTQFAEGDLVRVACPKVAREGSKLGGLHGTCCYTEQVEDNHAVTVEFETFGGGSDIDSEKSSSFRYCFNEHELQKLELGANMSKIVSEAEEDLGAYDHAHRSAAARGRDRDAPELAGIGGGKAANRFIAEEIDETQRMRLRAAVQTTSSCSKRLALGFCAPDAQSGLAALKSWVSALGLPRGRLLGMDYNGIPLKIEGKVYIKYNTGTRTFADVRANGGIAWRPGDAFLSSYDGDYIGVGFVPDVANKMGMVDEGGDDNRGFSAIDSEQYAYLPLDLF